MGRRTRRNEVVLASFEEVRVVQGELKLIQFRILGTDPCQRQREETHSNTTKQIETLDAILAIQSLFLWFFGSLCV
jgi:hypothetical protein